MDTEPKLLESFIGLRGRLSDGNGAEVRVTFSLYRHQEYTQGEPDGVSADGLCRVSDESGILEEFFSAGILVFLSGDELEATVRFTSPGRFAVIGPVIQMKQIASSFMATRHSAGLQASS